jgi:hypothetical protein
MEIFSVFAFELRFNLIFLIGARVLRLLNPFIMKKTTFLPAILLIFILLVINNLNGQVSNEKDRKWILSDRVFFGGNFGLQFGSVTIIDVSPLIGYKVTPKFSIGATLSYRYYAESKYHFKSSMYGGSIFSRLSIFQNLFGQAEIEGLNFDEYIAKVDTAGNHSIEKTGRIWVGNFLVGGGWSQPLGERGAFNIVVLWNLNETSNSPYQNPIIRMGFTF